MPSFDKEFSKSIPIAAGIASAAAITWQVVKWLRNHPRRPDFPEDSDMSHVPARPKPPSPQRPLEPGLVVDVEEDSDASRKTGFPGSLRAPVLMGSEPSQCSGPFDSGLVVDIGTEAG